jgi:hypothetical protein
VSVSFAGTSSAKKSLIVQTRCGASVDERNHFVRVIGQRHFVNSGTIHSSGLPKSSGSLAMFAAIPPCHRRSILDCIGREEVWRNLLTAFASHGTIMAIWLLWGSNALYFSTGNLRDISTVHCHGERNRRIL